MRTRDLCLFIPATLLLVALAAGDAAGQAGRLIGRVVDAENNEPIRGATISAQNPDAVPDEIVSVSDNKGRFAMLGMRSGTWTIVAAAPGYIPFRASAPIRTLNSNPVEFKLKVLGEPRLVAGPDGRGGYDAGRMRGGLSLVAQKSVIAAWRRRASLLVRSDGVLAMVRPTPRRRWTSGSSRCSGGRVRTGESIEMAPSRLLAVRCADAAQMRICASVP